MGERHGGQNNSTSTLVILGGGGRGASAKAPKTIHVSVCYCSAVYFVLVPLHVLPGSLLLRLIPQIFNFVC